MSLQIDDGEIYSGSTEPCDSQCRPHWVRHQPFIWLTHTEGQVVWQAEPQCAEPQMPQPEHLGLSTLSSKPGHHTMPKTGQAHPSRSQSSPLPGSGGTSEAITLSSFDDVHLDTHLPHYVAFCPYYLLLESPFPFLMFWSTKEKSTYWDCKWFWVQVIKALFHCGQDPSVSPFSYLMLEAAPAWQNLCQLNDDLPK